MPVTSVVVTGGVALWSKAIDARGKHEDRQHARVLASEGRIWEIKRNTLRNLITASRSLEQRVQGAIARYNDEVAKVEGSALQAGSPELEPSESPTGYRSSATRKDLARGLRSRMIAALRDFEDSVGEDTTSDVIAYAADPVRCALDELLDCVKSFLLPFRESIDQMNYVQLRLKEVAGRIAEDTDPDATESKAHYAELRNSLLSRRNKARRNMFSVRFDLVEVINFGDQLAEYCGNVVEAARRDLQGL